MLSRLCATCIAIGIAWCGTGPIAFQGPNVLLVTIDTLRADRLGVSGYAPARTPVIDGLARKSVRFADATAHAVLTYPSHVAIMTGRYPGAWSAPNGMVRLASAVTAAEWPRPRATDRSRSEVHRRSAAPSQGFDT